MPVNSHTCLTLACDVCGVKYQPDDYSVHFADLAEARDLTRVEGWTVTADRKVICGVADDDHQAALDALMPPEPIMQVPAQLGFDGSEEGTP
jgi:hypothetical protein